MLIYLLVTEEQGHLIWGTVQVKENRRGSPWTAEGHGWSRCSPTRLHFWSYPLLPPDWSGWLRLYHWSQTGNLPKKKVEAGKYRKEWNKEKRKPKVALESKRKQWLQMGGKWRVFGENRNGKSDKRQSQIGQQKTNREREEWMMSVADSLQPAAENRKHLRWNWSGGWKYWGAYLELDLAIHRRANENLGLKW